MEATQYSALAAQSLDAARRTYDRSQMKALLLRGLETKLKALHASGATHFGSIKVEDSVEEAFGGGSGRLAIRATEKDGRDLDAQGRYNRYAYCMLPTPAIFLGGFGGMAQRRALRKIGPEAMAERLANDALAQLARMEAKLIHDGALASLPLIEKAVKRLPASASR